MHCMIIYINPLVWAENKGITKYYEQQDNMTIQNSMPNRTRWARAEGERHLFSLICHQQAKARLGKGHPINRWWWYR